MGKKLIFCIVQYVVLCEKIDFCILKLCFYWLKENDNNDNKNNSICLDEEG